MAEDKLPQEIVETTEVVETEAKPVKKNGFVNPFESGVTYADFLAAVPKGKTVEEYCNKQLEAEQLQWLLVELEHFKNNTKNK